MGKRLNRPKNSILLSGLRANIRNPEAILYTPVSLYAPSNFSLHPQNGCSWMLLQCSERNICIVHYLSMYRKEGFLLISEMIKLKRINMLLVFVLSYPSLIHNMAYKGHWLLCQNKERFGNQSDALLVN